MSDSIKKSIAKVQPKKTVLSDIYNAELFAELFGSKIRWCRDYGGWFLYNGKVWRRDNNDEIKKFALLAHSALAQRMQEINEDYAFNHLKRSSSDGALNSMINCSKAMLGCNASEFDADELLINCINGTYDMKSSEFYTFKPEDMITRTAYVTYDPQAKCERWDKFLDEIFLSNKEMIAYMQRVVGYSMTALNTEQCMFILYGHGRNGKSKFIESIVNIMGDYAMNCPSSTFVAKQGNPIPNDVARLKGARFVTAIESNQNVTFDESMIKQMTGGDRITARFLNKEFFEFTPTFKIFFATNHKPNIRGTDTGIWRRINMIPFGLNITEEQEDRTLGIKLRNEASGVFNWMIEGYKQWVKMGLCAPNSVKEATELYREEEDDIGQFISQECVKDVQGVIPTLEFKERFKAVMGYYKGMKTVGEYMARNGYRVPNENRVYVNGKQKSCYVHIRWKTPSDDSSNIGWQDD